MRTSRCFLIMLPAILLFGLTATAAAGPYDSYLKPADVEKVTGLKGVKTVAKGAQSGAGGDLNFATADNALIVMVQIVGESQYTGFRRYFYKSDIKGLGDKAMEGGSVAGMPSNIVAFTKGTKCVALTAFGDLASGGKKFMLTIPQMTDLAKTIASRLK